MTNNKPRIMLVSEASWLATGFSVMNNLLLRTLHELGYEVAEIAAYGSADDKRILEIPWKVYPVIPSENDKKGMELYHQHYMNAQFGSLIFDDAVLDFKPDAVCVPPGSLVMTEDGYRPIQDIKIGDKILTHKGRFKKVLNTTRCQNNSGKIQKIFSHGNNNPLILTGNHPVLIYKHKNRTSKLRNTKDLYANESPIFVESKNVTAKDFSTMIAPQEESQNINIYIDTYLTNFVEKNNKLYCAMGINKCNPIPSKINLDDNLARLVGYFIGDGTNSGRSIKFFFGDNEDRFASDVLDIISNVFGIQGKKYVDSGLKNMIHVEINSTLLSEFFTQWIGKNKHKRIPKDFWLANKSIVSNLLCGWIRADGCYKDNTVSLSTSYKNLAYEYRMLCAKLKIPTNLQKTTVGKDRLPNFGKKETYIRYDVEGYASSAYQLHLIANKHNDISNYNIKSYINDDKQRSTRFFDDYMVAKIKKVRSDQDYYGQVYNIEVEEDNSYVVEQYCVHNCSYRDAWHDNFITLSPYRHLFKYIWSTCIDSEPPKEDWLEKWETVDLLSSYTKWGLNVLKNYGGKNLNIASTDTMPGVDLDVFKPMDKKKVRDEFGLIEDINIVLSVMRNQPRKLFPEIMREFRKFLDHMYKIGNKEVADKTFLYLHTSYPDVGFDIPKEILRYSLSNRVIVTYICDHCGHVGSSFFKGEKAFCNRCNNSSCHFPRPTNGVSREQLAKIFNIADLYIQHSVAGALEIPIIEAKACGLPCICSDYAAPYELNRLGACFSKTPILGFKQEGFTNETEQFRAIYDDDKIFEAFVKYFSLSDKEKEKLSKESRAIAEKYHDNKTTVKKWIKLFDESKWTSLSSNRWEDPPRTIQVDPNNIPLNLSNEKFVRWCVQTLIPHHHPDSRIRNEKKLLKLLSVGSAIENNRMVTVDKKNILSRVMHIANIWNQAEIKRYHKIVGAPSKPANHINYKVY